MKPNNLIDNINYYCFEDTYVADRVCFNFIMFFFVYLFAQIIRALLT